MEVEVNDTDEIQDKEMNIKELLKKDKKIIPFLGGHQSGTSFIVNNVATLMSKKQNVAILDMTKNKNSYYIYTQNREKLRRIAYDEIEYLTRGIAKGITTNGKLTVYSFIPNDNNDREMENILEILESLLKKHDRILIDCDFHTPIECFKYAESIYLIQTMDTLTIQPLTEYLSELKNKKIELDKKVKILINKYIKLEAITEKEIISGMSFYNEPTMSYMQELFDKNKVEYILIPFEMEAYEVYLNNVAMCNMKLDKYPQSFIRIFLQLINNIN